jgi:hypothetical protein
MSYRNQNVRVALKLNAEKKCIYCDKHRASLSRYCASHLSLFRRTGSGKPGSRILYLKEYRQTAEEVGEIIRLNRKSLIVVESVAIIDRLLFGAARGTFPAGFNRKAKRYLRGIGEHEPDATEIFTYLCGCQLMYFRQGNPFTDQLNYQMNLGNILLRWVRAVVKQPVQTTAHRQIARYLDRRLGPAMRRIGEAADKRELERRERMSELRKPLKLFDDKDEPEDKGKDKLKT